MGTTILIITIIPAELRALLDVFHVKSEEKQQFLNRYYYWESSVTFARSKEDCRVIICHAMQAGNIDMAIITTAAITHFTPSIVFLVGIAAGERGKVKIGQVILGERIVAYESKALIKTDDEEYEEPRSQMTEIDISIGQMMGAYLADPAVCTRIFAINKLQRIETLGLPIAKREKLANFIASDVEIENATIASGEKLIRNPKFIVELRKKIHGKIRAAEMEAAGFTRACTHSRLPSLVVRGISDFGDKLKNDKFHSYAAMRAVCVLRDFLEFGVDLELLSAQTKATIVETSLSAQLQTSRKDLEPFVQYFSDKNLKRIGEYLSDGQSIAELTACAFVSVSPQHGRNGRVPERCHHLGHALFGQMYKTLSECGLPTALMVVPSSAYYRHRDPDQLRVIEEIRGNWLSAFSYEVPVHEIHYYVFHIDIDDSLSQLSRNIINFQNAADRDVPTNISRAIARWRFTGTIEPTMKQRIVEIFSRNPFLAHLPIGEDIDLFEEFLAFLFMVLMKPAWFSVDWVIKCVYAFGHRTQSVAKQYFGEGKRLFVVEAEKNRIVWDSLAFATRALSIESLRFPDRVYFKTLKNRDLDDWMYSRDAQKIVPLWGNVGGEVRSVRDEFILDATKLFEPRLAGAHQVNEAREHLATTGEMWQGRLRQTKVR